ncbi:peptide-methionine (R)-S-oxide reductase MsrB [Mucilaginibacter auburnensis]|uniref:peptide-methionine (R)-S-oxide reductase n=1 Tax=Mucilaginibacter auburnensis TaxID=1457233 RepID=A0A2H9VV50_9SPHI|nr:peptide-methionine (R)-S-oxide reductase MsrB [Mucilaginibacter auburnensis]PJJ84704.1 peptide-methionine (R)-S-oxide reductase [Mucilaginibacter auburnensis]
MKKITGVLLILVTLAAFSCENSNGQQVKRKAAKTNAEWKKILNENQYHIMVEKGTESPFRNAYYDNHQKGVYVSAATGEVLFSSDDKYDSGTGWPSFVKPVDESKIEIVKDNSYGMDRDEVIERSTGLHLGHVFDDGPVSRGGKRYCMNSGALKFIKR